MGILSSFFKTRNKIAGPPLQVDMHSHLIPGVDDGAETIEDSLLLIQELKKAGFKKLIATPHIMGDYYKNEPGPLKEKLEILQEEVANKGLDVEIGLAAEYYLDEWFLEKLEKPDEMLSFGDNYLLVETSYLNEPRQLHEIIFQIRTAGFKPVMAHPERYTYLYDSFDNFRKLQDMGTYFQLNTNSLSGYYSKPSKIYAEKLIENQMIHFAGTDCHGIRHIEALNRSMKTRSYNDLLNLNLLNNTLL